MIIGKPKKSTFNRVNNRVNSFRLRSTGASGVAAGNISLRTFGGGATYDYILAGDTRGRSAIFTVPSGKVLYLTSILYGSSDVANKGVRFTLRATYDNLLDQPLAGGTFFMAYHEAMLYNVALYTPLELPIKLPARTDLKVSALTSGAGAVGNCVLRGWLENED